MDVLRGLSPAIGNLHLVRGVIASEVEWRAEGIGWVPGVLHNTEPEDEPEAADEVDAPEDVAGEVEAYALAA